MPIDQEVARSLAYRKNVDAIWRGNAPEKYTRLLPYIGARGRVLEIGAAEGVLALLMAMDGHKVVAMEKRKDRHDEAVELKARWKALGKNVDSCDMILGDAVVDSADFFPLIDVLVAVRCVYHLRSDAPKVINAAGAAGVPRIVLCGNKNRAARYAAGTTNDNLGSFNFFSSIEGMSKLLTDAGYRIELKVTGGDPVVVGKHHPNRSR